MRNTNWRESAIEAGKELIRVSLLAAVPLLISTLEAGNAVDWRGISIVISIAVLRAIDRFVHKWSGTKANGVIPF